MRILELLRTVQAAGLAQRIGLGEAAVHQAVEFGGGQLGQALGVDVDQGQELHGGLRWRGGHQCRK